MESTGEVDYSMTATIGSQGSEGKTMLMHGVTGECSHSIRGDVG